MVRRHEKGLSQPIELYRKRYSALFRASQLELGLVAAIAKPPDAGTFDIDGLLAEIADSETTAEAMQQLDGAVKDVAEYHSQAPARQILTQVTRLHRQLNDFKPRRKRLSQVRELYRIESDLLSHACLLLGDLRRNTAAEKYGNAALALAIECDANQAIARSALAKTLRWADRLVESAASARLGYEQSPATPIRIQLASQEANAAALLGDPVRAAEALRRAEQAAELAAPDSGRAAWSFSTGRQAIFALSVATHTGEPQRAIAAAATADAAWAAGEPRVMANWAQIRVGAGIAHLLLGSLEGAEEEVTPVFSLSPELRVATVTAYTTDLGRRLRSPSYRGDKTAIALCDAIRDFNREALVDEDGVRGR